MASADDPMLQDSTAAATNDTAAAAEAMGSSAKTFEEKTEEMQRIDSSAASPDMEPEEETEEGCALSSDPAAVKSELSKAEKGTNAEDDNNKAPPEEETQSTTKKKGKAATKKKPAKATKTKATVQKKPKTSAKAKKPTAKGAKKPAAKGAAAKKKGTTTSNKAAPQAAGKKGTTKSKAGKTKGKTEEPAEPDESSAVVDIFPKHYREFERALARLEKVDVFGYFWDAAPEEFVEDYTTGAITTKMDDTANKDESAEATSMEEKADNHEDTSTTAAETPPSPDNISFPSHAPFNWEMVRRRKDQGRYISDLRKQEEERIQTIAGFLNRSNPEESKTTSPSIIHDKGVNWDLFRQDVTGMCDARVERDPDGLGDGKAGSLDYAVRKVKGVVEQYYERTGQRQMNEITLANDRHQFSAAMEGAQNTEAAFQGKWRQIPFPERKYERLSENKVCAGLSELDERIATYELRTSLPDSFVGLSYKFEDDTGKSEAWMKSILSGTGGKKKKKEEEAAMALAEDDGVIRAQVATTMESLLIGVQDRVMTDAGVLHKPELRSANWEASHGSSDETKCNNHDNVEAEASNDSLAVKEPTAESMPDIVEQPVWGIDCYTRRNITECLATEFDQETALVFIEKWLLPAINACPVDLAHDIANAALILEGLPFTTTTSEGEGKNEEETGDQSASDGEGSVECKKKDERLWSHSLLGKALMNKIKTSSPPWLKLAAQLLRRARNALGPDFFRVHPKGHGSVVLSQKLEPNTLVTFYRGEVYPSWRWGEKMDAIDITQARKKLKPNLPDFYNMALERPQIDPRKYGLLFVDASRKAGHGSSLSHSCAPTCEVRVAAKDGQLCLAMTTLRSIEMGEELTFDYNAVTESLVEYRSAVCLCGYKKCRGSFLHFATADCYQQVLTRNAPIAVRFANLAKGCMKEVVSKDDQRTLRNHGFMTAAFGAVSVNRHLASGFQTKDATLDSMDIVPVWLQTYVADTLRYIEYERRALPIALICDHLSKPESETLRSSELVTSKICDGDKENKSSGKKRKAPPVEEQADGDKKAAKVSQPMPTFFFYSRANKEQFQAIVKADKTMSADLAGLQMERYIKKIASEHWKQLTPEEKAKWKKKAEKDWLKKGGGKAASSKSTTKKPAKRRKTETLESKLESSNISFQAADGEGASAMEQRIQQLSQTLSRVGRVLDRHREASLNSSDAKESSAEFLRKKVHSPLTIANDEQVVAWMWNDPDGIVRTLLAKAEAEECVSTSLRRDFQEILTKYEVLEKFGTSSNPTDPSLFPIAPEKARRNLVSALLKMRVAILKDLKKMSKDLKKEKTREKAERKKLKEQEQLAADADGDAEVKDGGFGPPEVPLASMAGPLEGESTGGEVSNAEVQPASAEESEVPMEATDSKAVANSSAAFDEGHEVDEDKAAVKSSLSVAGLANMDSTDYGESRIVTPKLLSEGGVSARTTEEPPAAKFCKDEDDTHSVVASVIRYLVDTVVARSEGTAESTTSNEAIITPAPGEVEETTEMKEDKTEEDDEPRPWLQHYGQRFKLQAAADLLLLYAKTSTFFLLEPYRSLRSTPIEVYAREIGNAVPRSVIDKSLKDKGSVGHVNQSPKSPKESEEKPSTPTQVESSDKTTVKSDQESGKKAASKSKTKKEGNSSAPAEDEELCEPDDIVAEVTVKYQGDYVLSQLLQWYNGGIGQSPGLPEMIGCIRLPPMSGCWEVKSGKIAKNKIEKPTHYESEVRPKLISWMNDPHQRGGTWPDEICHSFAPKNACLPADTSCLFLPLGTPVLDLLVTGDDANIESILEEFGALAKKEDAKGLLSTMDQGRPAQAVSNWVCCEKCEKWRKIPWYVDIDVVAEKFICSDNKWNVSSASCDAPEDDYEEHDNEVVIVKGANGELIEVPSPKRKKKKSKPAATVKKPEPSSEKQQKKGGSTKKSKAKKKDASKAQEAKPKVVPPTSDEKLKQREAEIQKELQGYAFTTEPVDEEFFIVGARMDIRRLGKSSWEIGKVVEVKADETGKKMALFHFPRQRAKYDEWVEVGSFRIAPLWSKVQAPPRKRKKGADSDSATNWEKKAKVGEDKDKDGSKEDSFKAAESLVLPAKATSCPPLLTNKEEAPQQQRDENDNQSSLLKDTSISNEPHKPHTESKPTQRSNVPQLSSADEDAALLLTSFASFKPTSHKSSTTQSKIVPIHQPSKSATAHEKKLEKKKAKKGAKQEERKRKAEAAWLEHSSLAPASAVSNVAERPVDRETTSREDGASALGARSPGKMCQPEWPGSNNARAAEAQAVENEFPLAAVASERVPQSSQRNSLSIEQLRRLQQQVQQQVHQQQNHGNNGGRSVDYRREPDYRGSAAANLLGSSNVSQMQPDSQSQRIPQHYNAFQGDQRQLQHLQQIQERQQISHESLDARKQLEQMQYQQAQAASIQAVEAFNAELQRQRRNAALLQGNYNQTPQQALQHLLSSWAGNGQAPAGSPNTGHYRNNAGQNYGEYYRQFDFQNRGRHPGR